MKIPGNYVLMGPKQHKSETNVQVEIMHLLIATSVPELQMLIKSLMTETQNIQLLPHVLQEYQLTLLVL